MQKIFFMYLFGPKPFHAAQDYGALVKLTVDGSLQLAPFSLNHANNFNTIILTIYFPHTVYIFTLLLMIKNDIPLIIAM